MRRQSSPFASSIPATSSKVTRPCFSVSSRARDLPKPMALPPPDCIWRMKNTQTPISSSIGNQEMKICARKDCSSSGLASTFTPYLTRSPTIQMSPGLYVVYRLLSLLTHLIVRPSTVADVTLPDFAASMNSE